MPQAPFTADLSLDQMKGKQAVLDTARATIVIDLLPERAPNHVGYFIKLAREGAYNGTTFHRAVKYGIIQGGDPLSRDPAKRESYGTGGLGVLAPETSDEKHTRGAVSAVVVPGRPNSAGAQLLHLHHRGPASRRRISSCSRLLSWASSSRMNGQRWRSRASSLISS